MTDFERHYATTEGLWDALSPTQKLFPDPSKPIFRGQANASWLLIPFVLRDRNDDEPSVREVMRGMDTADGQVFYENMLLMDFSKYCDQVGVRIPGDSIKFRETLDSRNNGRYFMSPELWPNPDLFEVMAFAQHHGIPTRLLDWCRHPYIAVYFAVESALKSYKKWTSEWNLAIWVINVERINLYSQRVQIVRTPGSVSSHLAAQSGLFTVQKVSGSRSQSIEPRDLKEEFMVHGSRDILKLTVPVMESVRLYDFCERTGVSAASLFPGADGAARAVHDNLRASCARQWLIDNGNWR